eukprot:TRINITY_DN29667_c0_g1_i1.p1 TRINITY_DN29667_c0_g1~~TRINITY_DN29667_c0_g1_i1.p1  ORF type:complete len:245 (+),score=41.13 TRINITY_DN29667_c0_g1_i1:45-779(+)
MVRNADPLLRAALSCTFGMVLMLRLAEAAPAKHVTVVQGDAVEATAENASTPSSDSDDDVRLTGKKPGLHRRIGGWLNRKVLRRGPKGNVELAGDAVTQPAMNTDAVKVAEGRVNSNSAGGVAPGVAARPAQRQKRWTASSDSITAEAAAAAAPPPLTSGTSATKKPGKLKRLRGSHWVCLCHDLYPSPLVGWLVLEHFEEHCYDMITHTERVPQGGGGHTSTTDIMSTTFTERTSRGRWRRDR